MDEARTGDEEDDGFEDECNTKYLVRNELGQLRCAIIFQFTGHADLNENKHYYTINNDKPFIGIIFDFKVLHAWVTPDNLETVVLESGMITKKYIEDQIIKLEGKQLPERTSIQFRLKPNLNNISGPLVLEYSPWLDGDKLLLATDFNYLK